MNGRKKTEGETDLVEVIRALDSLSCPFTRGDRRNQGRDQQGKNDNDKKLIDPREGIGLLNRCTTRGHEHETLSTNDAAPPFPTRAACTRRSWLDLHAKGVIFTRFRS